jgi:hypothetical protein
VFRRFAELEDLQTQSLVRARLATGNAMSYQKVRTWYRALSLSSIEKEHFCVHSNVNEKDLPILDAVSELRWRPHGDSNPGLLRESVKAFRFLSNTHRSLPLTNPVGKIEIH